MLIKMWTLLLLLGLGGALVLGDEDYEILEECEQPPRKVCPIDVEFPESRKELKEVCPSVITYFECFQAYIQKCYNEGEPDEVLTRTITILRDEICREDSLLNAAIGDNLKCMKSSMDEAGDKCDDAARNLRDRFLERQFPNGVSEEEDNLEEYYTYHRKSGCLRIYFSISCATEAITRKCGSIARGAFLDIIGRVRYFERACQPGHAEELLTVVPQLEIDEDVRSNLLEVLQLK